MLILLLDRQISVLQMWAFFLLFTSGMMVFERRSWKGGGRYTSTWFCAELKASKTVPAAWLPLLHCFHMRPILLEANVN